jgi:hypothetical protein
MHYRYNDLRVSPEMTEWVQWPEAEEHLRDIRDATTEILAHIRGEGVREESGVRLEQTPHTPGLQQAPAVQARMT